LFGLFELAVKRPEILQRAELVLAALNDELWLGRLERLFKRVAASRDRRRDADQDRHARIIGACLERDPRPERKPRGPERNPRIARRHEVERGPEIRLLADAVVERSGAAADAAEIESQHGAADSREALRALEHGLGVHRAALLRMRVRKHD